MKSILYTICFSGALGCSTINLKPATEVLPYVDEFSALTGKNGRKVKVYFGVPGPMPGMETDADKDTLAACYHLTTRKIIVFRRPAFRTMSEEAKRTLVWHELLHCVHGHEHTERSLRCDGVKYPHIMTTYIDVHGVTPEQVNCYRKFLKNI